MDGELQFLLFDSKTAALLPGIILPAERKTDPWQPVLYLQRIGYPHVQPFREKGMSGFGSFAWPFLSSFRAGNGIVNPVYGAKETIWYILDMLMRPIRHPGCFMKIVLCNFLS